MIAILAEQAVLDPGEVRPRATLADLGIDCLGLVETIFAIEEAFDIRCRSTPTSRRVASSTSAPSTRWSRAVESLIAAQK